MFAEHLDESDIDYGHLPLACSATDTKIRHHGLGIGSEVFVIGLFSLHEGLRRNLPIVRQGIIASMPNEPLWDKDARMQFDAYLTEVLATKGMSGSPVLVRSNRAYVAGENPPCHMLLLGLLKGHARDELVRYPRGEDFHAGISLVVPVQEILKEIEGEKMMKQRKNEDRKRADEKAR
jgi:hypothetical protein